MCGSCGRSAAVSCQSYAVCVRRETIEAAKQSAVSHIPIKNKFLVFG